MLTRKCKTLSQLKQIHAYVLKLNTSQNPAAIAPLLSVTVASCNPVFFSHARAVFQTLRRRSTFLYNTMIRGYVQSNLPISAVLCYKDMLRDGLIRNNYTFTPLMKACSIILGDIRCMGLLMHVHVLKLGFSRDLFVVSALIEFYALKQDMGRARELFDEMPVKDVVLWTAMIDGYGKMGNVEKAREFFDETPERNVVSWSALMAAYSRVGDFKEVISLYRSMEDKGLKPNESILVSALTACAHLGAFALGLWIHSYAKRFKYTLNPIVATALVDMYSKCGALELAFTVFQEIPHKDSGVWNAIISGVAMSGDGMRSLALFDSMIAYGAQPTEATLLLFLQLVVTQSWSGKLEEAEIFIDEKMCGIGGRDANIWGSLLGACRNYGNIEIGDRVWKKIADGGETDYGICVLAYNMYKEAGWEAQAKSIRKLLNERPANKKSGCSVIEVNGMVEEFHAGYLLHPLAEELRMILDSLRFA
ncbi:pentatricopeptide repeat-containing protein-like [Dorcoceras hygrometricum]|uniref:Pentatricopeptide repeat-containing protein-like n=1 Tax=Dorcoceras hygrometricum TaxID=472368 RepID=A0A2Z7BP46_9LAMI|nr:pentatricopeptide repeat-containing protein-like [Dorcoceras hygrometricum]